MVAEPVTPVVTMTTEIIIRDVGNRMEANLIQKYTRRMKMIIKIRLGVIVTIEMMKEMILLFLTPTIQVSTSGKGRRRGNLVYYVF